MGNRLVVCTVGGCRAVLCTPPNTEPAAKKGTAAASTANQGWNCRIVEGSIGAIWECCFFVDWFFRGWCFFVFFLRGGVAWNTKKKAPVIFAHRCGELFLGPVPTQIPYSVHIWSWFETSGLRCLSGKILFCTLMHSAQEIFPASSLRKSAKRC